MTAVRDDRVAWRHVPWGGAGDDQAWIFVGEDLHAATFKMQVRAALGDTGTPLVDLANASAGSQGISATYDAGYVLGTDTVGATTVTPFITQATLEAIPVVTPPSSPQMLYYDLLVTPSGGQRQLRVYGNFTLNPGVTL